MAYSEKTIKDYVFKANGTLVSLECTMFNEMLSKLQELVGQAFGDFASHYICDEWVDKFNTADDAHREWLLMEYVCTEVSDVSAGGTL